MAASRRVLAVGAAVLTVAASVAFVSQAEAAVPAPPAGMSLVFSDDFTGAAGTGLNRSNWLYDLGTGYPGGAGNWGTGEVESMTDSTANVYQDGGGNLVIKPIRDASGQWTSGRVETQRTDFAAPAGGRVRIEARLQQPNVSGAAAAGYWPAFWALGAAARPVGATNWPSIGEWDIMEDINGRSSVFSTLHCGTPSGGPCNETTGLGSGERACAGCQTGFHTYAVEYDRSTSPEQLRWYLDGANFFTLNSSQLDATTWNNATHHGMFVILNVAMGGGFPAAFGGGPTAATASGVPMLVDYVAVYQSAGGTTPPTSTPPTSTPPTTTPPSGSRDAYAQIQAESYDAAAGVQVETCAEGGQDVGYLTNGDWMQFDNVDFGTGGVKDFVARVASGAAGGVSGLVEVRVDSRNNAPIGTFAVANTGGWQSWTSVPGNVANVSGSHTVYLTFTSGQPADFVNVNWVQFRR
ncbi:endo-1,3-beta-glucanase [Actinoplanes sp. SE50]|uniref:carbohydrate-binding protein n=1 Tax=unclassified Actinoplanes TaxID=2626549 RepID=UPI00023EE031|nr:MULTISPECIES: carbohydrate-binding protein [unclassified Actinoplanes]AEV88403.1 Beta-glucanase [Actinoplanes sp. SE50/110]ATO86808.1 endo-1,3-beta-glucanase [Actinoplanes sp. SE50]SLM04226.1 endo-1,3-beta-glucanase [Actinoplanes sp. SE50/110]